MLHAYYLCASLQLSLMRPLEVLISLPTNPRITLVKIELSYRKVVSALRFAGQGLNVEPSSKRLSHNTTVRMSVLLAYLSAIVESLKSSQVIRVGLPTALGSHMCQIGKPGS